MDTGIDWQPATLKHWIGTGNESPLPLINGRYQCECGALVHAGSIVDLRGRGNTSQDWACDGCHSKWRRELVNVAGVREYDHDPAKRQLEEQKWLRDWLAMFGAPVAVLAAVDQRIFDLGG